MWQVLVLCLSLVSPQPVSLLRECACKHEEIVRGNRLGCKDGDCCAATQTNTITITPLTCQTALVICMLQCILCHIDII